MTCDEVQPLLGAFVLDASEPAERDQVERHLPYCPSCRREVQELREVPRLLGLLSPQDWERVVDADREQWPTTAAGGPPPIPAPPSTDAQLDGLLASAASVHTRRRWVTLAAAALLVLTGGGALAAELLRPEPSAVVMAATTWSATDPATGVRAEVRLRPQPEGTALGVDLTGVPAGTTCRLVVRARDGGSSTAASWAVDYTGSARVSGASPTPLGQVASLAVVTSTGRTLVRLSPPSR
jgi:hypothetical protein